LSIIVLFIQLAAQNCVIEKNAGSGIGSFSGDGGDALNATLKFSFVGGVWLSTSKKLFIADYENNRVRVVNQATNIITTFAGLFVICDC
jgi:DNA-binding beta-propeller fold protein YncE